MAPHATISAPAVNATHNPARRSWVESANEDGADFPIQNLPFGRFRIAGGPPRAGVAIGDRVLDLAGGIRAGLFTGEALRAASAATSGDDLTPLLALGNQPASALRASLVELLDADGAGRAHADALLIPVADVEMLLPLRVRQCSDMCVSTFHIGRRRGNDEHGQPICPPVFRSLPVGYDGRASSVVVSGTPIRRPNGIWQAQPDQGDPQYGPEPRQDYELEVGIWFGGPSNPLGSPIGIEDAAASIFGYCLLNDWSARGIQMWETMLGPFLGKSLATTVSPWIVTAEALAPFGIPEFARPASDPAVPSHLHSAEDQSRGGLNLELSARIETRTGTRTTICETNFCYMYWTPAQMLAHHASNGCSLAAGDLIGSGTCSGPALSEAGCLLEKNYGGPWTLLDGTPRSWLEDGDTVVLGGKAVAPGYVPIGFGEARGTLLPSLQTTAPLQGPAG